MRLRYWLWLAGVLLLSGGSLAFLWTGRQGQLLEVTVLLAGGATALWLCYVLLGFLTVLQRTARAISAGDLGNRAPLPVKSPPELKELTIAFNEMAQHVQDEVSAAEQERERLIAAMNSSSDAIIALDREARVLFANTTAEILFARSVTEIEGNPLVWIVPDEQVLESVRVSQAEHRRFSQLIDRGGRRFFQVVTTPIVRGGNWAVLLVFTDITEVKRTELIRRDFVANVSHELRSPLAGIKAVIETLMSGAIDDRANAEDFLQRADAEVDRLIQLVEELLELSRIESADAPLVLRDLDLVPLLRDASERLRPQAERKRQRINLEISQEQSLVLADRGRIERALTNLLHNAIKFTPEDGVITLGLKHSAGVATITVQDTGIGIDSEDLPRIFERFYKSDHSRGSVGTGLGLAIVKHTAEAHGGSVSAESRLGLGSTFSLLLPLKATESGAG